MFEEAPEVPLGRSSSPAPDLKPAPFNWKAFGVGQLVAWRDEITRLLPATTLKDLDLEEELLLQYHTIRELQGKVLNDESLPLNQRAQVANTVGNTLIRLEELQRQVYTQERFKAIEGLVIRHMSRQSEEVVTAFMEDYEKVLRTIE